MLFRSRAGRSSFDNGVSATRARAAAEVQLVDAERRNIGRAASLAANLLGVLEFDDSVRRATNAPAPVERSLAEFENAVRADPANVDAKYNLELLLRSLQAKGVRPGQTSGVGNAPGGHQGAGSSPPGRGY